MMDPDHPPHPDHQIMLAASPTRGAPELPNQEQEENNLS